LWAAEFDWLATTSLRGLLHYCQAFNNFLMNCSQELCLMCLTSPILYDLMHCDTTFQDRRMMRKTQDFLGWFYNVRLVLNCVYSMLTCIIHQTQCTLSQPETFYNLFWRFLFPCLVLEIFHFVCNHVTSFILNYIYNEISVIVVYLCYFWWICLMM
jgi:hypothetical protein